MDKSRRPEGTPSKDSSYIFVASTKNSPKDKSSSTKGKVTSDTSPKPKEAEKELESEDLTLKTFQLFLESQRQTLEIVIGNSTKGTMTKEEKLD